MISPGSLKMSTFSATTREDWPNTSLAAIICDMTAPDSYSSLENMAAEANGSRAAATVIHFIFATMTEEQWMESEAPWSIGE